MALFTIFTVLDINISGLLVKDSPKMLCGNLELIELKL